MEPLARPQTAPVTGLRNKPTVATVLIYAGIGLILAGATILLLYLFYVKPKSKKDCVLGAPVTIAGCDTSDCSGYGIVYRPIVQEAQEGGLECDTSQMVSVKTCTQADCVAIDCSYTDWSEWSQCPPTFCGTDDGSCRVPVSKYRIRIIAQQAGAGGKPCDFEDMLQYEPCNASVTCLTSQTCLVQPWSEGMWEGCPPLPNGCRQPGDATVFWEYAHRGILSPSANGGADCSPADLIQSRTCDYPTCTTCTLGTWSSWSECTAPCGTGTQFRIAEVEIPGDFCSEVQTQVCNTQSCPPGSFDTLTNPPACSTPAVPSTSGSAFTTCSMKGATLAQCLAACAADSSCAGVQQAADGTFTPLSSLGTGCGGANSAVRVIGGTTAPTLFSWNPAGTNCVKPSLDVVYAACMERCAGTSGSGAASRGFVTVGGTGSTLQLTCPVTDDMLTAVGLVCTQSNGSSSGGSNNSSHCPASTDCVPTPWSSADPWSVCNGGGGSPGGGASCNQGASTAGMRTRVRGIAQPQSFLGQPCTLDEGSTLSLITQTTCNSSEGPSSATNFFITNFVNALPTAGGGPGFDPQKTCSTLGFQAATVVPSTVLPSIPAGQELFMIMLDTYAAAQKTTVSRAISDMVVAGLHLRYATYEELVASGANNAYWCEPGFFAEGGLLGAYPGCGGSIVGFETTTSKVQGAIVVGKRPPNNSFTGNYTSVTTFGWNTVSNVATMPRSNLLELWVFVPQNLDFYIENGQVVPAMNSWVWEPANASQPCSLSAWTDVTTCGSCLPPAYKVQQRSVVAPATGNGCPCSAFALQQNVSCATDSSGVPRPQCLPDKACVYSPWPSVQPQGTDPCTSRVSTLANAVYKNSWDVPVQNSWKLSGLYEAVDKWAAGDATLTTELATALNAQCLNADGSAPVCIDAGSGSPSLYSLTADGWVSVSQGSAACVPDSAAQQCIQQQRPDPALMYAPSLRANVCPSLCPMVPEYCSFSDCSSPCASTQGTQYVARSVTQFASFSSPSHDPSLDCSVAELFLNQSCYGPAGQDCWYPCPFASDGSMCGSSSNAGYCNSATGDCVCTGSTSPDYEQVNCLNGCPVGAGGSPCSSAGGNGTCGADGTCICANGFTGAACEIPPLSVLYDTDWVAQYLDGYLPADGGPASQISLNQMIETASTNASTNLGGCVPLSSATLNASDRKMLASFYGAKVVPGTCGQGDLSAYNTFSSIPSIPFSLYYAKS